MVAKSVGDVMVLVKATEFGLATNAVDAGYPLQVLEAPMQQRLQPRAAFLRINESVAWISKWLQRDTIAVRRRRSGLWCVHSAHGLETVFCVLAFPDSQGTPA